ncbi:MAG: MmcQ/YjbR family DNA-binding protein [Bacteroidota bacterium]|jgi:predicted DNA-binding protein (MmcQ/YjbR family)
MIDNATFRRMALAFPDAVEMPHFEKRSFRVKKKIFATLNERERSAVVKLSKVDQSAFCSFDALVISPAPGLWGGHGWTTINLKLVRSSTLKDALTTAYNTVVKNK